MTVNDILNKYPESFFKEETRCDYLITEETKKIWCIQIDLLEQLKQICKKHDIKYFASSGTLIGAYRHNGYIPWDDDIDIDMLREDYDKLCKVAPKELKYPYFFQTEKTDQGSLRGHAQIRNSLTTGILNSELDKKYKFNQGIFIDIFVMDVIPEDPVEKKQFLDGISPYLKKYLRFASLTTRPVYFEGKAVKQLIKKCVSKAAVLLHIPNKDYIRFEDYCKSYSNSESNKVTRTTLFKSDTELIFNKSDFFESEEVAFEFTTISAPKNYDSVLTAEYGPNWRTPLRTGTAHGEVLFDVFNPYTKYIKN